MSEIGIGCCNESDGSIIVLWQFWRVRSVFPSKPFVDVVVQHAYHGSALKRRGRCGMEGLQSTGQSREKRKRMAGKVTAERMKLLPARLGGC